ncbi:TatD family hydrolase [Candidatus Babeliales bacterium]|nr:TatD family hydrolase [Candidatus Babeliales bacterium]MCF7899170.1 TatD family hydrolase [Candidatus Babeliales bacterium]
MFVDTHCHLNMMVKNAHETVLNDQDFILIKNILQQANLVGVQKFITIGTTVLESINSINIAKKFPQVFACVGIHPCDCDVDFLKNFEEIKKLVKNKEENKIVAIGETGLDFFHKPFDKQKQIDAFKSHIELSCQHNLPIVVHVRDSAQEVLKVLEKYKKDVKGVIHCFFQDEKFAQTALSWGFYLGISGPINYPKNQELRQVVAGLPADKILLETDAPFLPPQEFRGKQNNPAYIPIFAQVIADLKKMSLTELENITTKNAENLFKI